MLLATPILHAGELAIVGATVIASPQAEPLRDAMVLVRDGRIVQVGRRDQVALAADVERIDGRGGTVLAGFWNSHVHLLAPPLLDAARAPAAAAQAQLRQQLTRWGFTSVFELAGLPDNTLALRRRIDAGELQGPLLLTVDAPFYPEHGTPVYVRDFLAAQRVPSAEVADPDSARQRAQAQLRAGADGSKLFAGAIVGGAEGVRPMPVPIAQAVVEATHAAGKPVFAHPTDLRGIEIALQSGVDVLAHTTPAAGPWPQGLAQRLAREDVALVPTLALFELELGREGAPPALIERFAAAARQQVGALRAAGGTLLFGTDVGFIDEADTRREIRLLGAAGVDSRALLEMLTTAPAQRFGYAQRKGRVAAGYDADLVLVNGDPLRDPLAYADVAATIRGGQVIHRQDPAPATGQAPAAAPR
ncbi:amidohydrolase family protein [Xanthomonas sp. AmX2]|nr:amidohydrolase family protein [Xanthomonas sp.]